MADKVVLSEKASQNASLERTKMLQKEEAEKKSQVLKNKVFVIKARTGENGKMFGAITSKEIVSALSEQGIDIDKKQIVLDNAIKSVGEYVVEAKLFQGVVAKFKIIVE